MSGRFSTTQRDALALLTGAYLAGAATIREGSTPDSIIAAGKQYLRDRLASIRDADLRAAAQQLLDAPNWALHGLGLDLAKGTPKRFRAGNVICFEPSIRVDRTGSVRGGHVPGYGDGTRVDQPPTPA